MTEQQAQSPIDDLFRKTFENQPASPAESGWDTPSDRVWQHVQANISKPNKGWGTQSLVLIAALLVILAAGMYWMFIRPVEKPAIPELVTPLEQPVATPTPASGTPAENQPIIAPKPSKGANSAKDTQSNPAPRNSTEEHQAKPANNTAQPLPGSKPTLPPNTTEAQKKKGEGN
ncbi:MAG: hypothetical protein H7246_21350 [Phycisphaerae bacterium]|nr:hypothetical protein [Saprospiraceae bacterium]